MYIEEIDKKSLSPFDDKRFIKEGGVKTLPFGYLVREHTKPF